MTVEGMQEKNVHMERQKQSAKKSRVHILGVFVLREKRERTGKKKVR